jgi:chromate reductase
MSKPIRILGITGHLRQIFVYLNMFPINQPEVMIGHAEERFDLEGNLTDMMTKELILALLQNLVEWTRRIGPSSPSS